MSFLLGRPIFRGELLNFGEVRGVPKSGDVFSFKFWKRNIFKALEANNKNQENTEEATSRARVLFCFPAWGEIFPAYKKGESLERKTPCHFVKQKP